MLVLKLITPQKKGLLLSSLKPEGQGRGIIIDYHRGLKLTIFTIIQKDEAHIFSLLRIMEQKNMKWKKGLSATKLLSLHG